MLALPPPPPPPAPLLAIEAAPPAHQTAGGGGHPAGSAALDAEPAAAEQSVIDLESPRSAASPSNEPAPAPAADAPSSGAASALVAAALAAGPSSVVDPFVDLLTDGASQLDAMIGSDAPPAADCGALVEAAGSRGVLGRGRRAEAARLAARIDRAIASIAGGAAPAPVAPAPVAAAPAPAPTPTAMTPAAFAQAFMAALQAGSHGPTYVNAPNFVPAPHATPAPTPPPAPVSTPPNLQAAIAQAFQVGLAAAAAPAAPAAGVPATIAVAAPTAPPLRADAPACRYFAQGNCRRGASCPFRHETH